MNEKSGSQPDDLVGMEIVITRTFDAPRDLAFRAWTDGRHVTQWFGPGQFTNPVCAKSTPDLAEHC